jgi:hypothetical protein
LAYRFQREKNLNIFPIGSYVKTMSADGGHLGWRSGSQDIILKVDHPDLHPRWPPSVDIVLTYDPMGNMFKNLLL